jgi:flavin-binding protein dodecin
MAEAQQTEIVGESTQGFSDAARDAASKAEDALGKGNHTHKKVRLEVDINVTSPGGVGTYRVIVTP